MRGRRLVLQWVEELDDGTAVRGALVLEKLPAPPRCPDVEADIAAAVEVRDAHERRGFGRPAIAKVGSTLRLVPPSRRAA